MRNEHSWLCTMLALLANVACAGDVSSPDPFGSSDASAPSAVGTPGTGLPADGDADGDGLPNAADPDHMDDVAEPPSTPSTEPNPDAVPSGNPPVIPTADVNGDFVPSLNGEPIHARLVRLTHPQWENSVRDLLRLSAHSGLSEAFEGDPPRGTFGNNERALEVTSTLWGDYQRAAESLAEQVAADVQARQAIMGGADAAAFVRQFGLRTFRRPLTPSEEQTYLELFNAAPSFYPDLDMTEAGFRLVVEAMLQSPHFIYRSELGEADAPLDAYEVASKLSFLLRNTTPDEELLAAAQAGELSTSDSVRAWAERMVAEAPISEAMADYNATLFGTHRFQSIIKDQTVFPEFNANLSAQLQEESDRFLDYIFSQGLGVRELLTSTTGMVNATTAGLYGVPAPIGGNWAEADLGPDRPGFFTRLGFLAYNGTNTQPDPIHRGVDLNHRILCVDLAAPPGELPQLPPLEGNQTNRERVVAATEAEGSTCVTCHGSLINPLGFAFENYDSVGQLRTMENGKLVQTASSYRFYDGEQAFSGAIELTEILAESQQVHSCYARHIAEFTLGRDLTDVDLPLVTEVTQASLAESSIKELILSIVESDAFLTRMGTTTP